MFENLVVALDGSASAARAFDLALALAKAEASTIAVCSVADALPIYATTTPDLAVEGALDAIQSHAQDIVDGAIAKARAEGVTVKGSVLSGEPVFEIVSYASKIDGDAIVIGTHGRTGLQRLFLGSVAEGVVRSAPIPVVIVREDSHLAPTSSVGKLQLLVPIDGSESSLRALEVAAGLATSLEAEVIACNVVDLAKAAALSGGQAQLVAESLELLKTDSTEILQEAAKRVAAQVCVATRSAEGEPVEEIERLATEIQPAFIVIGTHGRTGISRAVMGSVAEGVVRRAPVPVIVVPYKNPTLSS